MISKCYVVPTQKECNCNCVFCISKTRNYNKSQGLLKCDYKFNDNLIKLKNMGITRFEITGGGEPFLNKDLKEIVNRIKKIIPESYIKVYTNGFILKEIGDIDELDISIASDNDEVNKKFMLNKSDIGLLDKLEYFRKIYPYIKLRLSIALLNGAMDSKDKLDYLVNKTSNYVDEYVVRTLYPDTPFKDSLYVDFEYDNPKVVFERDNCACELEGLILWSDNKFYKDWDLSVKADLKLNVCLECKG